MCCCSQLIVVIALLISILGARGLFVLSGIMQAGDILCFITGLDDSVHGLSSYFNFRIYFAEKRIYVWLYFVRYQCSYSEIDLVCSPR